MSKNIIKHILLNIVTTRKILKSKIFYSKGRDIIFVNLVSKEISMTSILI